MARIKAVQIGVAHDHAFAALGTLLTRTDFFDFVGYVVVEGEEKIYEQKKDLYKNANRLSLEEVFAIEGLQAAFIETDDCNLTKYAFMAAKHGLAVQMDKPGGQDDVEFDALIDYCQANNVVLHLGYMYRYNPAIQYVLQGIKNGEYGEVYYTEAQMNCFLPKEKREWLKGYKGGMMNFLGCHLVDLLLQIQGEPKNVIPYNASSKKDGIDSEDSAFAIFEYEKGNSFIKSTAVECGGFMRRQLVICCEKATIELNPIEAFASGRVMTTDMYITPAENSSAWAYRGEKKTFEPFERYENMYLEFADIVLEKMENPYSYEYERRVHKLLLKACGV